MPTKQKLALLAALFSTLIGVADISQMVGFSPSAMQLITLFASGFGAGASVVAARRPKLQAQVPNTRGEYDESATDVVDDGKA